MEYHHESMMSQSQSKLNWPVQGKPDETSFRIWKRYIKLCFINPDSSQTPSMGEWNIPEILKISPRYGYYDSTKQHIHIPVDDNRFHKYTAFDINRRSGKYNPKDPFKIKKQLPKGVTPVDIYNRLGLVHFNFTVFNKEMIVEPPPAMIQWHRDILQNLQVEAIDILQHTLSDQKTEINIVSDGGVHNYQSNYGLIIAAKSPTIATNKN
jgi:hypothetical protein